MVAFTPTTIDYNTLQLLDRGGSGSSSMIETAGAVATSDAGCNVMVTLMGMAVISLVTTLIGAAMGLQSERTSCCISRHSLQSWCVSRPRRIRARNCRRYRITTAMMARQGSDESALAPAPLPARRRRGRANSFGTTTEVASSSSGDFVVVEGGRRSTLTIIEMAATGGGAGYQSSGSSGSQASTTKKTNVVPNSKNMNKSAITTTTTKTKTTARTITTTSNHRSNRSNLLLDLARMQDWNSLIQRCQSHPSEARLIDMDGLMPLHWACSGGPPIEAVQALLKAYPCSAHVVDLEGSTALHFLCHYGAKSPDIVQMLYEYNKKAIRTRDVYGRTPLYHACDKGASIDVLKVLLRHEPRAATLPKYHGRRTPLSMTWKAALPPSTPPSYSSSSLVVAGPNTTDVTSPRFRRGKKWDKAMLLLHVTYTGRVPQDENDIEEQQQRSTTSSKTRRRRLPSSSPTKKSKQFRMVHAAISVAETPPEVFDAAIKLHPKQVEERDEEGRLPLHIACSSAAVGKKTSHNDLQQQERRNRCKHMILTLLEMYPASAGMSDRNGRLPLCLALENGWMWDDDEDVLRNILLSHYDALFTKDFQTLLYPFMLAAVGSPPSRVGGVHPSTTGDGMTTSKEERRLVRRLNKKKNKKDPWYSAPVAEDVTSSVMPSSSSPRAVQAKKRFEEELASSSRAAATTTTTTPSMEKGTMVLDDDLMQLNTIFQLLRQCPESARLK